MSEPRNAHILVVEDDATTLEAIQKLLIAAGYRVTIARGGAAAFRAYEADQPDLVVTDLNMAGGDGYVLIHRIRQLARTPIIVVTGANTAYARQRVEREFTAVGFLTKPFVRQRFVDLIALILHGDTRGGSGGGSGGSSGGSEPRTARAELVG